MKIKFLSSPAVFFSVLLRNPGPLTALRLRQGEDMNAGDLGHRSNQTKSFHR